jgi:predicted XRE-type DNA-binding protein
LNHHDLRARRAIAERGSPANAVRRTDTIRPSSGDVFADLGLDAANGLQAKAMLMSKVASVINAKNLSEGAAASMLGIDRLHVSALMNGKLSMFSTETLLDFLTKLDADVDER